MPTDVAQTERPLVLSLSKDAGVTLPWFDRLITNGDWGLM
jgi:hypothetical protein